LPGGVLAVAFLELQKLAREVVSLLLAKLNLACNVRQNVLQSPARRPSMARERAGLDPATLAKRSAPLKTESKSGAYWKIRAKQAQKVAHATHTPEGFLFLQILLRKVADPDFRLLNDDPVNQSEIWIGNFRQEDLAGTENPLGYG